MSRIYCRSPYYVNVTGVANDTTSCELFIWNGTGSAPLTATYTLSKPIPSSLLTEVNYNVSEYIQEYITHDSYQGIYNTTNSASSIYEWCNVTIKLYKNSVLQSTTTYKAYYGFGYYESGYNPTTQAFLLTEGTYYYAYDDAVNYTTGLSTLPLKRGGSIMFEATSGYSIVYTNLVSGATYTISLAATKVQDVFRVYPNYYADGNKVEFKDNVGTVLATYYFRPSDACKYEPVVIDFVNIHGAWQREFMMKASRTNIEVQESKYHLMQPVNYTTTKGTIGVFNKNGKQSVSVNTGWVSEDWNETLRQLMLSERILVDGKPATLKTQGTELFEHINEKLINYKLDFEYANFIVNNI
jgi:hypothetical protein